MRSFTYLSVISALCLGTASIASPSSPPGNFERADIEKTILTCQDEARAKTPPEKTIETAAKKALPHFQARLAKQREFHKQFTARPFGLKATTVSEAKLTNLFEEIISTDEATSQLNRHRLTFELNEIYPLLERIEESKKYPNFDSDAFLDYIDDTMDEIEFLGSTPPRSLPTSLRGGLHSKIWKELTRLSREIFEIGSQLGITWAKISKLDQSATQNLNQSGLIKKIEGILNKKTPQGIRIEIEPNYFVIERRKDQSAPYQIAFETHFISDIPIQFPNFQLRPAVYSETDPFDDDYGSHETPNYLYTFDHHLETEGYQNFLKSFFTATAASSRSELGANKWITQPDFPHQEEVTTYILRSNLREIIFRDCLARSDIKSLFDPTMTSTQQEQLADLLDPDEEINQKIRKNIPDVVDGTATKIESLLREYRETLDEK